MTRYIEKKYLRGSDPSELKQGSWNPPKHCRQDILYQCQESDSPIVAATIKMRGDDFVAGKLKGIPVSALYCACACACLSSRASGWVPPPNSIKAIGSFENIHLRMGLSATTADIRDNTDVAFVSPLLDYGYRPVVEKFEKGEQIEDPILIYLPGFDGSFLSPFLQFPELSTEFDVRCMKVGSSDRSTYADMKRFVMDYIQKIHQDNVSVSLNITNSTRDSNIGKTNPFGVFSSIGRVEGKEESSTRSNGREIFIVGESFGGILAVDVSLTLLQEGEVQLAGLTLVNPATCFDRSRLAALGPEVAEMSPWLYATSGLGKLLPLFTDEFSFAQLLLILQAKCLPSVINSAEREAFMGRVAFSLPFVLPSMPQDTLDWRLREWLQEGCSVVSEKLPDFKRYSKFRTLVVVGEKDTCLPSIDEAERLSRILPSAKVHVVDEAGHASTCGSRIDLTAVMRDAFGLGGKTEMSRDASLGKGEYFGMEPRYDNASIGLSPLMYWSGAYFKKFNKDTESENPV